MSKGKRGKAKRDRSLEEMEAMSRHPSSATTEKHLIARDRTESSRRLRMGERHLWLVR
jgi:hypothetical protein